MSLCASTLCLLSALSAPLQLTTHVTHPAHFTPLAQKSSSPGASEMALLLREKHGVEQVHPLSDHEAALRAKLRETSIRSLALDGETIEEAARALSTAAKLPIEVDRSAMEAFSDGARSITLDWPNAALLTDALDTLCFLGPENVCWTTKGATILITTSEEAQRTICMHLHPVGDIMERYQIEILGAMVRDHLGSWDHKKHRVTVDIDEPMLNVVHTRDAQLKIEAFIDRLRECHESLKGEPRFEPTRREIAWKEREDELSTILVSTGASEDEVSLAEALMQVSRATDVNFVMSSILRDEIESDGDMEFMVAYEAVPLSVVLDRLAKTAGWLKFHHHGGVVRAHHADEVCSDHVLGIYDVREIVSKENAEGAWVGGLVNPVLLEMRIAKTIVPESWEKNPANSVRITEEGILHVNQQMGALIEIRALLKKLQAVAVTARGGEDR